MNLTFWRTVVGGLGKAPSFIFSIQFAVVQLINNFTDKTISLLLLNFSHSSKTALQSHAFSVGFKQKKKNS